MMSKTVFYIILGVALAWFYAGSILVWRFVIPELYSLLIKRKDVDKKAILEKERARRRNKQQ
jgi:hypothetical protein